MMKTYRIVPNEKAYKLINTGALILVSTCDRRNIYNLTPIAWHSPVDFNGTTRLLIVCDLNHKAFLNITETHKFIVCIPHADHYKIILQIGDCSGNETNKIKKFRIPVFPSEKFQYSVIENSIAYLECENYKIIKEEGIGIVFGEVVYACADEEAFSDRLLTEKPAGKTLHHLGGKKFMIPGDIIL